MYVCVCMCVTERPHSTNDNPLLVIHVIFNIQLVIYIMWNVYVHVCHVSHLCMYVCVRVILRGRPRLITSLYVIHVLFKI